MKVSREVIEKFVPVVVTLETQDEVDKLFAVVNFIPIARIVDDDDKLFNLREGMESNGYSKYHKQLSELL
jgi:hypothetical protein